MALTVVVSPPLYSPVYNDIVFVVDSDNKTECNFKYIADIYVNGSSEFTRLKLFPNNSNGYATFKINDILQNYVTYDLKQDTTGFQTCGNSICDYIVEFGEETSGVDCASTPVITSDMVASTTRYAWNGAFQYQDFKTFDYQQWIPLQSAPGKVLTNRDTIYIDKGAEDYLYFLQEGTNSNNRVTGIVVKTYKAGGVLHNTLTLSNSMSSPASTSQRMLCIGVGPENLNNTAWTTSATSETVVIWKDIVYYTVEFVNGSGLTVLQSKRYNYNSCFYKRKYEPKRMIWLNRLGGMDALTFNLKSTKQTEVSRTEYTKQIGRYNGSTYTYSIGDRGRTVIDVKAKDKFTINSDWLTENEIDVFEELYTSPVVFELKLNLPYLITNVQRIPTSSIRYFVTALAKNQPALNGGTIIPDTANYYLKKYTVGASFFPGSSTYIQSQYDASPTGGSSAEFTGGGELSIAGFTVTILPVVLSNTSYEHATETLVRNKQLRLEYEYAFDKNLQKGS